MKTAVAAWLLLSLCALAAAGNCRGGSFPGYTTTQQGCTTVDRLSIKNLPADQVELDLLAVITDVLTLEIDTVPGCDSVSCKPFPLLTAYCCFFPAQNDFAEAVESAIIALRAGLAPL
jgi:hypothetical protein